MTSPAKSDAILTADPGFLEMAVAELVDASPGATVLATLEPGVLLVALAESFWELAARWLQEPPVFVRHVNPVQVSLALPRGDAGLHALRQTAEQALFDLVDPSLPFSVQTRLFAEVPYRPYDVNTTLAGAISARTGAALDVRQPQQILSVVVAHYQGALAGFLGLSPAVYNLSDWAGGQRRFAREQGQISRAEFKLLEALESFGLALPANGVALDLGAAPGGWVRVLRQHEQFVTAVDPAELHPALAADRNVRHKQMTAEAYLEAGPDQYDLITNDMRLDARDSARLMVAYAPYLYRHGQALMTLKLPEEKRERVIDHAFNILRQAYTIERARQLFHNRSEITVLLRPLQATTAAQER
jgi:23S rRNA (cytidine2498-2'-O)-methyltransferase